MLNLRARLTGSVPLRAECLGPALRALRLVSPQRRHPEILSVAKTVPKWKDEIIAAVLTGIRNFVSESLNRLATLEARRAYGFP
jgi:transposase